MRDTIRNFVIIAHIDHGKSTLADRLLEVTGTVEARKMHAQYLDQLDLEQERGITIKLAPVRMQYLHGGKKYTVNLIDTPGHSDFAYEVSRSLAAVEGAVLLVDATQGVQAQTLANFRAARAAHLTILGAVNKVDLFRGEHVDRSRLTRATRDLAELIGVSEHDILHVSGKTGEGVPDLLTAVIDRVPPPRVVQGERFRALVFDSFFDTHKGVVASVRVVDGSIAGTDTIHLAATGAVSKVKEVGHFVPALTALPRGGLLEAGDIGYLATGIRDPLHVRIGDTVFIQSTDLPADISSYALPGYREPKPVVFVSFYPEESDDYEALTRGLQKLKLNDASLTIEPDQNEVLGRGYKVGCLGRLHFEITAERLKREFGIATVNTFPSVAYRVRCGSVWQIIVKPEDLPSAYDEIQEPIASVIIILPTDFLGSLFPLHEKFRMEQQSTVIHGDRAEVTARVPLAELVSDFDDALKSLTAGYASFSYDVGGYVRADILKVDVLLTRDVVPGLSRFFAKESVEREARSMVSRLKDLLPKQQFPQPIQAVAGGRVIAREDIPALRKDVTGYLYGGDRTRKMKLWKKQKAGKERLTARSRATIPPDIFKELLRR